MSTGGSTHHRLGSRTVALIERRGSLVRLLIALFIAPHDRDRDRNSNPDPLDHNHGGRPGSLSGRPWLAAGRRPETSSVEHARPWVHSWVQIEKTPDSLRATEPLWAVESDLGRTVAARAGRGAAFA